ncbi:hypothetical protein K0U07_04215 [bacterium]|nr:hypothetical protein [bacterium]
MKYFALLLATISLHGLPLSHKVAQNGIAFAEPKREIPFTGFYRIEKQCKLFFKDLGAETLDKTHGFSGFYLSSASVKYNSGKVFGKWREQLRHAKNTKLIEIFEANLASHSLSSLFSFPAEVKYLREAKEKTVLIFLDYTLPAAMQAREILNFSLRGYNVLVVDFFEEEGGSYFPPWERCKEIAESAYDSLSGEILLYGKSFGAAAAAYLAYEHPPSPLILDRPFSSMEAVAGSFLFSGIIDRHYSYPVQELVEKIKNPPFILSADGEATFANHAKHIFDAYRYSHKIQSHDTLCDKCLISVPGGHYSSFFSKGKCSWFSYGEAQRKLNQYLLDN